MRKNRNLQNRNRPSIGIVVDGKTEFWYFQMIIRNEKDKFNIRIKPELPEKKELIDQFKLVNELAAEYLRTFWIIDLDVILKETRETKKGSKSKIIELSEYIFSLKKKHKDKVIIIINNPCLEFWFLSHFKYTSKPFNNCLDAEKNLRKYLLDYNKSEKYFTKQGDDIYQKLKPFLLTAIENTKRLGMFNIHQSGNSISEMAKLFETNEFKGLIEDATIT